MYNCLDPAENPLARLNKLIDVNRHRINVQRQPGPAIWVFHYRDFSREVLYEEVTIPNGPAATLLNTDFPCGSLLHSCTDCQATDPFIFLDGNEDIVYAGTSQELSSRPHAPRKLAPGRHASSSRVPWGLDDRTAVMPPTGERLANRVVRIWLEECLGAPLRMVYLAHPRPGDRDFGVPYVRGPYTRRPPVIRFAQNPEAAQGSDLPNDTDLPDENDTDADVAGAGDN
ncbi:hypothetical protein C8F01DRAFT_1264295 [Mycena amicta]|nr:hypothetical protein C8F01DRAFT_1264295 [Mycena amicta]